MLSQPSVASEPSQREDSTATPSQNPAACEPPAPAEQPLSTAGAASSSTSSDSKRGNAAQLARELGSSSPWSETLIPQRYGTMSARLTSADRQETGDMDQTTSQVEQDIDPPPVYTRIPQSIDLRSVYELPAETVNSPVTHNPPQTRSVRSTDDEENHAVPNADPDPDPDVETPLLAGNRSIREPAPWSKPTWRRCLGKQRQCYVMLAVVFFSAIVSLLLLIIIGIKEYDDSWWFFHRCPKSTLPMVHTGPEYERHETNEDIGGAYKLYDAIWLTTSTGAIDIEIDPQPADHPAVLILTTITGSITLHLSPGYRCQRRKVQRTIYTHIQSLTGDVVAEILLGNGGFARVDTAAGLQNLSVLTYGVGFEDEVSNLTTQSNSGTQKVVLTTLEKSYKSVSNVRGLHHSFGTSPLDILYPSTWTGKVHAAASLPGLVSVSGNNLKYTRQYENDITAYRGEGANLTLVEVISEGTGRASFKCR